MNVLKKPISILIAVVIIVSTLIGVGVYISRSGSDERAQPSSVRVEVAQARKGSLVREMTVVGTLESANSVTMKAQVKGLITKVNIIGGEEVKAGDVLFEIDPRSYQARAKEAQALFNLAKTNLDRQEELARKNFAATKNLEEARAQFLKAQAQLESAQKDLEDTKITAPFEGFVGLHSISVGTPISADLALVTLTDTDPMKVNFKMPSKFVRYLSLGQKVGIEVDSYPGRTFDGRIEAIDALVDAGAQSIAVQATIPNPANLLKPGMFVRVKVTVGSKDNSLIIPEESIVAVGDQTYVWKVIEHPEKPGLFVVFRVEVLTGIQEKDRIEITRNLREGDIVVTVGYQKVANGVPVSFDKNTVDIGDDEAAEEATAKSETPASDQAAQDQKAQDNDKASTNTEKNTSAASTPDDSTAETPSLWSRIKGFFSGGGESNEQVSNTTEKADGAADTDSAKDSGSENSDDVGAAETAEKTDTEGDEKSSEPNAETENNDGKE